MSSLCSIRYCTGLSLYPLVMVDSYLPDSLTTIIIPAIAPVSSMTLVSNTLNFWGFFVAFTAAASEESGGY